MLDKIRDKVMSGNRLTKTDAMTLFRSDDIYTIGELASHVSRKINGKKAFYVRNLHVNPTNICVNRCKFCSFSRSATDDDAYELTIPEIIQKIKLAMPINEMHMVSGLHPDWPLEHYLSMIKKIKRAFPELHVKAFTAAEIDYFSNQSGISLEGVLASLKDAGLDSMPGGGAEIFSGDVRGKLCPEKLSGDKWLEVMRKAHGIGIRTNATMLYGHIENYTHRVDHLMKLRDLQDDTGGFQAFIPLSYQPMGNEVDGKGASGLEDLKTIAVSRLVLDNFAHIKAYWVMLGEKISQLALMFGADDLDGTIMEEKITYAAGAQSKRSITEPELITMIKKAGRTPVRRDSFYKKVS